MDKGKGVGVPSAYKGRMVEDRLMQLSRESAGPMKADAWPGFRNPGLTGKCKQLSL